MIIIATKYHGSNKFGDYEFMIKQDMKQKIDPLTLYIYNDNTESYDSKSCRSGIGNAVIRKYNKYNKNLIRPFSVGIPTGSLRHGGFTELDNATKKIIDHAITKLRKIITKYGIKKLYYATNNKSGIIGQSLFEIDYDVRKYITQEIKKLSKHDVNVLI